MSESTGHVMSSRNMVERPLYMNVLKSYIGTEQIKVLTGIRRCGKSSLLTMLREYLLNNGTAQSNVFYKRFDEFGTAATLSAQDVTNEIQAALDASDRSVMFYVFLDEIQEVDDWPRIVRGLHTLDNVDVYITGSNAHMLSTDLATQIAGRTVSIPVHPLSFAEYLTFVDAFDETRKNASHDELFADYVRFGGMPSLFSLRTFDVDSVARELDSIFNTVILRDVAQRLQIRDLALLNRLTAYLFSTTGNLFSTRKVVGALTSNGRKTTSETVDNYIEALLQAYILFEAPQAGLQGKNLMTPLRKFYVEDNGLRNRSIAYASRDYGFQLENVVANELVRRGYQVHVGAAHSSEVDFVATRLDERIYIQVTETMLEESTRTRELKPLQQLQDSFPKIVLTLDHFRTGFTDDGIEIVNIVDWLLK